MKYNAIMENENNRKLINKNQYNMSQINKDQNKDGRFVFMEPHKLQESLEDFINSMKKDEL